MIIFKLSNDTTVGAQAFLSEGMDIAEVTGVSYSSDAEEKQAKAFANYATKMSGSDVASVRGESTARGRGASNGSSNIELLNKGSVGLGDEVQDELKEIALMLKAVNAVIAGSLKEKGLEGKNVPKFDLYFNGLNSFAAWVGKQSI